MSDSPAQVDLVRKRSRSSSPGVSADSPAAAKKANTDPAGPSNLTLDDDTEIPSAAELEEGEQKPSTSDEAAVTDPKPATGDNSSSSIPAKPEEPTPMNVDSDLPANPEKANTASEADAAAAAAAATIQMRALIVTQDASIIIGKGGKNVNEIRDKSGSKITITESVPGNPERVMVIAGQLDAVSKVSWLRRERFAFVLGGGRVWLTLLLLLYRLLVSSSVASTTSPSMCLPSPARAPLPFGESTTSRPRFRASTLTALLSPLPQLHHPQLAHGIRHRQGRFQDQGDPGGFGR